jgi:hypothetical protein
MLAVEYAHRNAKAYDTVYLIPSDSPWSIHVGFAQLAGEMRVPEQELVIEEASSSSHERGVAPFTSSRLPRAVTAVKNRLARRGRWLLIFDDVREPKAMDPYLPSTEKGGQVILTSRNPIWRGMATVTVRGFERAESVSFLLRRTGEIDAEAADTLAEELGDLPLALAQAGAYIEETGRPLAEYLALFRQRPAALLERPASFPVTVANTWETALAEVFRSQPAADLLSMLAFLPLDELPRRALASQDQLALDDAIAVLRLHSLLEVSPLALSVHRLVKVIVRHQLRPEDRRMWAEAARRLLQRSGLSFDEGEGSPDGGTEPDLP